MTTDIWKRPEVAAAFLDRVSVHIPDRAKQLEVMFRALALARRAPQRLLDLGAGDALILASVLEAFPEAEGVAVDFSPHMLERARARLARFGSRAVVREADLASPQWRAEVRGTFDAVLSSFAIHHLAHERKRALYGEIYDLLDPGGIFLNLEHVSSATEHVEELFNDAMVDHLYASRRERGEECTPERVRQDFLDRPDRVANILAPVEEQCAWLRALGFRDVDCFWKYFELAIFGGVRP
jgi:tRNA (cmo5U34)-methyltransferase